jgi:hypothetical protein
MTDPANRDTEASADGRAVAHPTATTRKPYRTPQLRHLGSVRELTLGGSPVPVIEAVPAGKGGGPM